MQYKLNMIPHTQVPDLLTSLLSSDQTYQAFWSRGSAGAHCENSFVAEAVAPLREITCEDTHQCVTSPHVAPLESRLHSYKLAKPVPTPAPPTPVLLQPLLSAYDLPCEVADIVASLPCPVRLYPLLLSSGFYSEAVVHISRCRPLRADAPSFDPSDKENDPNSC